MKAAEHINPVQIGPHTVGIGNRPLLIAEIGINHNGSVARAKELILQAKDSGANVVKFQKRSLDELYTPHLLQHVEDYEQGFQYILPVLKEYELEEQQMTELKEFCDFVGVTFLCTPFDITSARYLHSLNIDAYKIASADLTNMPLIEEIASYGKPMLLSTGMSLESEIEYTVNFLREQKAEFVLLHCVSSYPVDPQNADLERIKHLSAQYQSLVGYSGHDLGTSLSLIAISLGACLIEKHFTNDRLLPGPDHKVSLLPEELRRLAARLREEKTNGVSLTVTATKAKTSILQGELLNKQIFRKSIVLNKPISKGETFTAEHLTLRSPGGGFTGQQFEQVIGISAPRDFSPGEVLAPENIDQSRTSKKEEKLAYDWGQWGYVVRYHDFPEVLIDNPQTLEFHLTYQDTTLELPIQKLSEHRDQLKQTILRIHCCEYLEDRLFDLCSPISETRSKSLKIFQRVLDLTAQLHDYFAEDQPAVVFNCGAMTLQHDTRSLQVNEEQFLEMIQSLDCHGALLLAQNMPPCPWYYGGQWKGHYFLDPEELIRFCNTTGHSVCLDLSHASMAAKYLNIPLSQYILQLKDHVRHLHVSDACSIEGEGTQIGSGDVDFREFISIFRDYEHTWIPEIWQGHVFGNAGAKKAITALSEFLQEAEKSTPNVVCPV